VRQALPETGVSRETGERLAVYLALLAEWNPRINLVAPAGIEEWRVRHVEDSAQLRPLLPERGPFADLGSGAGLPGLVLAAVAGEEWHMVESDQRKCAFLREAARRMGLANVAIHAMRIEAARLPPLRALTARALAPLARLLPHAHRLLAPDGVAILPKGRSAERELTAAGPTWLMRIERFASRTEPEATILRLSEIRPARD
jgi:16S rRNA (guanine(527)-N(7))-methyltransferase RsmG